VAGQAITHKGFERIEHHAPVMHGDTLYAESEVLGKSPVPDRPERGLVEIETRGRNQDGKLIMTFCRKLVVPVRSAAAPVAPTEGAAVTG
jgi:acyl dehydratase